MYTKFKKINSNGFTLIEIIASIAILGMVIAVFLPIFPQIMSWTEKTDDELVASNLLSQVANDIKDINVEGTAETCPNNSQIPAELLGESSNYEINENTYSIDVRVCQSAEEEKLGLHRDRKSVV